MGPYQAQSNELAEIYHKGTSEESLTGTDLVRFLALVEIYLVWLEDVDSQFMVHIDSECGIPNRGRSMVSDSSQS